jgi:hypothetical protein
MNYWPLVPYQVKARLQVDASLALPIQHDEPQGPDKVNWLPAPQVGFAMTIKAVWSCTRGAGTMPIVRLPEKRGTDCPCHEERVADVIAISWDGSISGSPRNLGGFHHSLADEIKAQLNAKLSPR